MCLASFQAASHRTALIMAHASALIASPMTTRAAVKVQLRAPVSRVLTTRPVRKARVVGRAMHRCMAAGTDEEDIALLEKMLERAKERAATAAVSAAPADTGCVNILCWP